MKTAKTVAEAITCSAVPFTVNGWTILKLPIEASAKLPSRGQVMVTGTINAVPFQSALEPDGRGSHWLHITVPMQKSTGAKAGKDVDLVIEPTNDWPEPEIPADWQAALDANSEIMRLWQRVTPLARWEWLRWIASTNREETRKKHIEVACSKLLRGERRPCCFNRSASCVPEVSKGGMLIDPTASSQQSS